MPGLVAAEQKLAFRAGLYLTQAGIDFSGPSPVPAFQDAIGEALVACGRSLPDPSVPTDQDVLNLPAASWWKFLDVAELRLLETAAGPITSRGQSQRWADYSVSRDVLSFTQYLQGKRDAVMRKWSFGLAPLTAGTIDLNFSQTGNEM
jgi:hypothetical protein